MASIREHTPRGLYRVFLIAGPESVLGDWADGCTVVRTRKSFVFSHRVNLGLRAAGRDDVILLNNDVRVTRHWFDQLTEYPRLAACRTSPGNAGNSMQLGPGPWIESARALNFYGVYLPRWVLDNVGELDERFTAYGGEDIDYCARACRLAIKSWISPAYVEHDASSSFGREAYNDGRMEEGHRICARKWGGHRSGEPLAAYALPRISVIMPAHNAGRWIDEAIRSMLGQTYRPQEIIVIDDASTDDTTNRAKAYEAEGVKVKRYRRHRGAGAARNRAVKIAAGDLLAFQDADDFSDKNRLQKQLTALARYPGYDVCHCGLRWLSENGYELPQINTGPVTNRAIHDLSSYCLPGATFVMRRRVWNILGGQPDDDPHRGALDFEFSLKALAAGLRWLYLDEPLYTYRRHTQNLSGRSVEFQRHCDLLLRYDAGEFHENMGTAGACA